MTKHRVEMGFASVIAALWIGCGGNTGTDQSAQTSSGASACNRPQLRPTRVQLPLQQVNPLQLRAQRPHHLACLRSSRSLMCRTRTARCNSMGAVSIPAQPSTNLANLSVNWSISLCSMPAHCSSCIFLESSTRRMTALLSYFAATRRRYQRSKVSGVTSVSSCLSEGQTRHRSASSARGSWWKTA